VGDEQGRGPDLGLDPTDLVPELGADLRVERRQRLVEQHRCATASRWAALRAAAAAPAIRP